MLEFIKYMYIGFLIIPIYSIFRLLRQYWLYIGYKALNSNFSEWDSKTEKARIYLFVLGFILFVSAFNIKNIDSDDSLNYTLLISSMFMCILANLLMVFIWTKKFKLRYNSNVNSTTEQILDSTITNIEASKSIEPNELIEKSNTDPVQNPVSLLDSTNKEDKTIERDNLLPEIKSPLYNKDVNLNKVIKELKNIQCEEAVFKKFLFLNKLSPNEHKIKTNKNKTDLIRFIFIVFDLKRTSDGYIFEKNKEYSYIIEIIHHYFEYNKEIEFYPSDSTIARVIGETLEEESKLERDKNKIKSIFLNAG